MLRTLTLTFLLLAPAAHAALTAGVPVEVAAPVIDAAPFDRNSPEVASNGRDFLSVWGDWRTGGPELRGARFDASGRLLDETGFRIAIGNGYWYSVASDGDDYVVTYDCNSSMYPPTTCIAAVDAGSGRVEYRGSIPNSTQASVASTGDGYLLVYSSTVVPISKSVTIRAVALDGDGNLAGQPVDVGASPYVPAIAASNDRYLIVWSTYGALFGSVVKDDKAGVPQTITRETASWGPGPFSWTAASDGRDFMVVWQQNTGVQGTSYVTEMRSNVVTAEGIPGRARAVEAPERTWYPSVTWTGRDYFVTYTAAAGGAGAPYLSPESDTKLRRLSLAPTGERSSAPAPLTSGVGREGYAGAASNGSTTLVAWQQVQRTATRQTWSHPERIAASQIVATTLADETPVIISRSVTWQRSVDADERVVVWEELVGAEQRRKIFVQPHGVTGRGFEVSATLDDQYRPTVGGSLVVWIERPVIGTGTGTVLARRLDDSGRPFGEISVLGEAARESSVAIASNGGVALVAWESTSSDIVAARVLGTGRVIDSSPILIADASVRLSDPEIASDGNDFFVTWRRQGGCIIECIPPTSVHGVVVGAAGTLLSAQVDLAPMWSGDAAILWNGSDYVFFWQGPPAEERTLPAAALFVRRISRGGILRDAVARRAGVNARPLDVVWTGEHYALVSTHSASTLLAVYRLDRDFALVDTAPLGSVVADTPAALVARGEDTFLAAWQRRNPDGISRAVIATLTETAPAIRRRSTR